MNAAALAEREKVHQKNKEFGPSANDVIGYGKPLYRIERWIENIGVRFMDGAHILYVNGEYRGNDPVGKLMHDFACANPSEMYYDILSDRVKYFKESKKGRDFMCKILEDM